MHTDCVYSLEGYQTNFIQHAHTVYSVCFLLPSTREFRARFAEAFLFVYFEPELTCFELTYE